MTPDTVPGSARSGNSHHLDSDTCILKQRDLLCVYCSIGNQHGPPGGIGAHAWKGRSPSLAEWARM